MELKKSAVAGTLESSDVQVMMQPNPGGGVEIAIESVVKAMFGDSIEQTVRDTLAAFGVTEALVQITDKGALDHVIRSRVEAAICRAAEHHYDWSRED